MQWLSQSLLVPRPTARLPTNPPSDLKSPDLGGHRKLTSNFTKMLGLFEDWKTEFLLEYPLILLVLIYFDKMR